MENHESEESTVLPIPNPPCAEAQHFWSSNLGEYVKLREVEPCPESLSEPLTIHTFLSRVVQEYPHVKAVGYKVDPKQVGFEYLTYAEYYRSICTVAKAFIKLGLEEGRSVCLLGFNCPQWFIGNFAAIFAGGLSCGIYSTNSADACRHIMSDSGCDIILVENRRQLDKILQIKEQVPRLKKIVVWSENEKIPEDADAVSWKDLVKMGEEESDDELITRLKSQVPNQCCALIYTSGTTGDPKGVMMSHDNLTWTTRWVCSYFNFLEDDNLSLSYLPLSHIAGQLCEMYLPVNVHGCVHFCDPDALKGTLKNTLNEVRPSLFLGVPRVYEKMQEKMQEVGRGMGKVTRWISSWARNVGYQGGIAAMKGLPRPITYPLAHGLVLNRARAALGLDRCYLMATAAAPITKDTLDFFLSLGMPLMEIYGMSESTGPQTFNKPGAFRLCSVGRTAPGGSTKIEQPDEDGNGEVCMFGRNVFMGYFRAPEKTKEAVDKEGWLHSGDIGRFDEDGYLYITGRIKEIIITAGGENVAPVPIEDRIRLHLPCISNAMVVGDKMKFLSVLLTFKTLVDEETGMPQEELTPAAREWVAQQTGGEADIKTVTELRGCHLPAITKALEAGLKKANEQSISRAAVVQKFLILPRDFSIAGGELGPTLKLRRGIIVKMYSSEIQQLYEVHQDA